ncbi:MAG: inositol monophosphatase [Gammaproteobacteria bacterium]|nr:inositol monophosphatase [Gammaproteobacteria bacterium]
MPTPMLLPLLDHVLARVLTAGELLIAELARSQGPRGSGDKAAVDVEIEQQLRDALLVLKACDFWGEETGRILTGNRWCWVVDPNDGTSDFLQGRKGSALSVALLHEATPVLGVVYAPVTEASQGDCIAWAEGLPSIVRNGVPVALSLASRGLHADAVVMVSAAAATKPGLNAQLCAPARFLPMPSIAYRLARVAAGDGVCAVSLYPVSAHDVAAGHALLRASGGVLLNQEGRPLQYRSEVEMETIAERCFGGAPDACRALLGRDWAQMFRGGE